MTALRFALPSELPASKALDPFALEPGVLLFEGRFCVVEPVSFGAESWSVVVSDVKRSLGEAPHHRLRLNHLPLDTDQAGKLRLAAAVDETVQEAAHHWVLQPSGTLLITQLGRLDPLPQPLTASDAILLATALADLLQRLHDAGVVGVRFQADHLHLGSSGPRVSGFEHLLAEGTAADDVVALTNLLSSLDAGTLGTALRPAPPTARALYDRIRALRRKPVLSQIGKQLPARAPFVARETALRAMLRHFEAARRGEAQVVGVVGEAGMGKSRLMEQTAEELGRYAPCLILRTGHGDSSSAHGNGFVSALSAMARDLLLGERDEQERIAQAIRSGSQALTALVAALSPSLATLLGSNTLPPTLHLDEQFVRHASTLAAAIRSIGTRTRPVVVLLDDAHALGEADLAVLRFLLDESEEHHTLVVAFSRSPIPETLDAVIPTLYPLMPFTTAEIERVLAASLPSGIENRRELAQALWQHSRGNPLTLWATLQTWIEEGYLSYRDDRRTWFMDGTPRTSTGVVDLFRHHFRRLSLDARYVGLLATLHNRPITRMWLQDVTQWDVDRVGRSVHELLARGIAVQSTTRTITMPRGALSEMVLDSSGQRRVRSAHRQIAKWLEQQPRDSIAERSWHQEHATPEGPSQELVVAHMRAGQRLLEVYNLKRARWHFERAQARSDIPDSNVDAIEGLGDIQLLSGDPDLALEHYLTAMERSDSAQRGAQIAAKAVYGFYRRGSMAKALSLGQAALQKLGEPTPEHGWGTVSSAAWTLLTPWRRSRLSLAERDALCKLYPVLATLVATTSPLFLMLYIVRGAFHARDLATANASTVHMFTAQALAMAGAIYPPFRARERRFVSKGTELAMQFDDPWALGVVHHVRGTIEFNDGQWKTGQTSMDMAVQAFARSGDMTVAVLSILTRVMHTYNTENGSRLLRWIRRAEVSAVRQRAQDSICTAGALRAVLLARMGEPSAEPLVDSLVARLDSTNEQSIAFALAEGYVAEALLLLGRAGQALERANRACTALGRAQNISFMLEPFLTRLDILLSLSMARPAEYLRARTELFMVRMMVRRSPSAYARWQLLAARYWLLRGAPTRARKGLEHVVATASVHQHHYATMHAHVLLASLVEATAPTEAVAHRQTADTIARQLGLPSPNPGEPDSGEPILADPVPSIPPSLLETVTPISAIVGPLLPALEETLPPTVTFRSQFQEHLGFSGDADRFQLLMVNMVFAARDLIPESGQLQLTIRTDSLPDDEAASPTPVLAVEVTAGSISAPVDQQAVGGWSVCEEIATTLGGSLDLTHTQSSVRLTAYLPAAVGDDADARRTLPHRDTEPQMVVIHGNERTRATVAASVMQLGFPCHELSTADELTADTLRTCVCLFVESGLQQAVAKRTEATVIQLIPRGVEPPVSEVALRVPFVFGDLADIVDSLGLMDA